MNKQFSEKSKEEMIKEANDSLKNYSKEYTQEEEAEMDAEFGYQDEDN